MSRPFDVYRRPTVLIAVGVLLIAVAAMLHISIVPARAQLSADADETRIYTGTARHILNPARLASGDLANAWRSDLPVTVDRRVRVVDTEGPAAEVQEFRILRTADGAEAARTEALYAVDRKTLEAAGEPPPDWDVVRQLGLTVGWPIGAERKVYPAWVNDTGRTVDAKFVRDETRSGVKTFVYSTQSAPEPITNPQVLKLFPAELATSTLAELVPFLPISAAERAALIDALPSLGDSIALRYTYAVGATYWVEPTTGLVVDTERDDLRSVILGDTGVVVPVYDVSSAFSPQSAAEAAELAREKRISLNLFATILPIGLSGVGALLLIGGVWRVVRNRPRGLATVEFSASDQPLIWSGDRRRSRHG